MRVNAPISCATWKSYSAYADQCQKQRTRTMKHPRRCPGTTSFSLAYQLTEGCKHAGYVSDVCDVCDVCRFWAAWVVCSTASLKSAGSTYDIATNLLVFLPSAFLSSAFPSSGFLPWSLMSLPRIVKHRKTRVSSSSHTS
jgi:hypothetical protein